MTIDLDLNRRLNPILNLTASIQNDTIQRTLNIALPFLSLNAKTGQIASIGLSLHRTWVIFTQDDPLVNHIFELAQITGTIAMSLLFPALYYGISQVVCMAQHLWLLIQDVRQAHYADACKHFLLILSQLIHIASVLYAVPELLALSLLSQALTEFCSSLSAYKEGHLPEMLSNAALGCIRIWQAAPHLVTVHRNYLGKTLTQKGWEELYSKIETAKQKSPDTLVDVESYLIANGISSHVRDIDFQETNQLTSLLLQNMRFKNCDFSSVSFEKSRLHNVVFDSSLFHQALWIQSIAQTVHFSNCQLQDSAFIQSLADRVSYTGCDLTEVAFNSSSLSHISIDRSKMEQTSFLFATVHNGSICHSELRDVLFTGTRDQFTISKCRESSSGKPVIALTWNFHYSGLFTPRIKEAIQKNEAIALRFECFPDDIDPILLEQEVHQGLADIAEHPSEEMLSRPHELLKRATGGEIGKIKQKAEILFQYIDGLSISGGFDIEPEFYGQTPGPEFWPEDDFRRSMIEFSVLDQAYKTKTPTMGTCRGSQITNVFMGGDLIQNVEGQWATFQDIEWTESPYADLLRPYLGEKVTSYSSHHQAAGRLGKDLQAVLQKDGIIKFFISRDQTFIGSQVHPEIHVVLDKEVQELENIEYPPEVQPIVNAYIARYKEVIAENQNIYRFFISKCLRT